MSRASGWLWFGLILLFLLLVYYMAGYDLVTGPGLALHSSRRYDPFGSSAFRELLESRGVETDLLERPTPPDTRDTTLIMILPVERDAADLEDLVEEFKEDAKRMQRIMDWVAKGNRLLVLSRDIPHWLPESFGLRDPEWPEDRAAAVELEDLQTEGRYSEALEFSDGETVPVESADAPGMTFGGGELYLFYPLSFTVADGENAASVLAGTAKTAFAATTKHGEGWVTYVGDPTPILNFAVTDADNAAFLLAQLGDGSVLFDEYSLGLGHADSIMDWLKRAGLLPMLAQAVLAMFLLARSSDSRFAPAEAAENAPPPAEEQLRVLASLYENSMTAGEVAERTARELERRRAGAKRRMTRERSDGVLSRRAFPAVGVDRFRVEAEAIADLNASAAGQGGS